MEIKLKEITIKELVEGFKDNLEEGIVGFSGKLDIRPKYQREFIYGKEESEMVIRSIMSGFPINTMYWAKNKDVFELLDGQQRTISICKYFNGDFSVDYRFFHNLDEEEKSKFLDYKILVYVCDGTNREKLEWFRTINIAGLKLTDQELLNAAYTGSWLDDAKKQFSKTNCPAYNLAKDFMKGSPIRQDYLAEVLSWISSGDAEKYMSENQNEDNANELWLYFSSVINWVKVLFPNYRKEMKGIPFGILYNKYKDVKFDSKTLESEVKRLMKDEDVTKKSGIYHFLISGEEKFLSIRTFSENQKREVFEKQQGICPVCNGKFEIGDMEADHIVPWSDGGKTTSDNCQMLCKMDNRRKGAK